MTTKSVPLTCSGHTRPVVHLEYSQAQNDATYSLLSSCKDGNPMLRDWLGDWVGTFLGHKGAVWSARLSGGDANRAVTGSADFSAKVWDTYSGECLQTYAHQHIVRAVAIDYAGGRILTGGHEKKLRLFDVSRGDDAPPDMLIARGSEKGLAHDGTVRSVVWQRGEGERCVVSAGEDKVVRWWDTRTLSQTAELTFSDPVVSMERQNNEVLGEILTLTSGKDVHFLNLNDRTTLQQHSLQHAPSSVTLHPTLADRFMTGTTTDGWVRVYDYASGTQTDLHKGHHGPVHTVAYSPDGELAASGSEDGTIRLWQTFPGRKYGLWA